VRNVVQVTVSISDARVSCDPQHVLATYALGSCIGVAVYDPVTHAGGMLHFQLPTSTLDSAAGRKNPLMFADTGMDYLLQQMAGLGAQTRRLRVTLAGAAQILNDSGLFNIGRRNHAAIRKLLWQKGLLVEREDIGGESPRNLYLNIADGAVLIKKVGLAAAREART
jgi:chemotaxis protein CheD